MNILGKTRKSRLVRGAAVVALMLVSSALVFSWVKKVSPLSFGWYGTVNHQGEVAAHGYDPVAYRDGRAVKGLPELSFEWRGAHWLFSTEEHRDQFRRSPEAIAPKFGAFCAFAASKGFTADADPEVFHVVDGKTFLFADEAVKKDWLSQLNGGIIEAAQANWQQR